MATINISLEKQLLTIQNREIIASGDSNYDVCAFSFDEAWKDFIKTAVFYQDRADVYYAVLDAEDKCTIPAPALVKTKPLCIGVFGVSGNQIITSSIDSIPIVEGAVSGQEIDLEISENIFASIVANYQAILSAINKQNEELSKVIEWLQTLNAFDVIEVSAKLDSMNEKVASINLLGELIMNRELILRNIEIAFIDKSCKIIDDRITENSLCDVYFDEYSYEIAANALILPISHNGYIELNSSTDIKEKLTANILVRRK